MMAAGLWPIFRKVRATIFTLCALLSIAWTVILILLLAHEFSEFSSSQRFIVLFLTVVNGCNAVLLYLMIVVILRLWLDAARVFYLFAFQSGGTVLFLTIKTSLPCNKFGSVSMCRSLTSIIVLGGWTFSGLLIFYAIFLAIMFQVPQPKLPKEAESSSVDTDTTSKRNSAATWIVGSEDDEKRSSFGSNKYAQRSFPPTYPPSPLSGVSTLRAEAPYPDNRPRYPFNSQYASYRSNTSSASSARSFSTMSSGRIPYQRPGESPYSSPTPSRVASPAPPPGLMYSPQQPQRLLPNPFGEPIQRYGTPVSMASSGASIYGGLGYGVGLQNQMPRQPEAAMIPVSQGPGAVQAAPPPYAEQQRALSSGSSGDFSIKNGRLDVPSTPMSLRPAVHRAPMERAASPAASSVHSMSASLHMNSPSVASSVASFYSSTSEPKRAATLPPSQQAFLPDQRSMSVAPRPLPENPFNSGGMGGRHEMKRSGSVPNLNPGLPPAPHPLQRYGTAIAAAPQGNVGVYGVLPQAPMHPEQQYGDWRQGTYDASRI